MFTSCPNTMTRGLVALSIVFAVVLASYSSPTAAQQFQRKTPTLRHVTRPRHVTSQQPRSRRVPSKPSRTTRNPVWGSSLGIAPKNPKAGFTTSLRVLEIPKPIFKWSEFKKVTDPGDLALRFSWSTGWSDAVTAQLEVSRYKFESGPVYTPPVNPDLVQTINTLPETGKSVWLDLDFAPIVQDVLGTVVPPEVPVTFYVRMIVKNGQGAILGAPSKTVRIVYQGVPGSNTQFKSMTVRCTALRCIEETDEVGADKVTVHLFVADLRPYNPTSKKLSIRCDDMDQGETETFSKLLYDHPGPSDYNPDALVILIGLMENDDGFSSGGNLLANLHMLAKSSHLSLEYRRRKLARDFDAYLDHIANQSGDDRIGGVQRLGIPMNTWTAIQKGQNVAPPKLVFQGDGGEYEVRFSVGK